MLSTALCMRRDVRVTSAHSSVRPDLLTRQGCESKGKEARTRRGGEGREGGGEGSFQKMGQTRSRLGRKREEGLFRFVSAWFPKPAAASLADWHRLPFGTQSNSFATGRRTSRRRRRPFPSSRKLFFSFLVQEKRREIIGRDDASRVAPLLPPRICASVRAAGHRLRFLRDTVSATVAAAPATPIVPATAAAGVQDDRQPEAFRRRETDKGAGVQQDRRAAPRVPDTGHPSTR